MLTVTMMMTMSHNRKVRRRAHRARTPMPTAVEKKVKKKAIQETQRTMQRRLRMKRTKMTRTVINLMEKKVKVWQGQLTRQRETATRNKEGG